MRNDGANTYGITGAIINVSTIRGLVEHVAWEECAKADRELGHNALAYKAGVQAALTLVMRAVERHQR